MRIRVRPSKCQIISNLVKSCLNMTKSRPEASRIDPNRPESTRIVPDRPLALIRICGVLHIIEIGKTIILPEKRETV